jgi:GNAT superfamily N-acetyltransferase
MILIRKARKTDFEELFRLELEYAKHNNSLAPVGFGYKLYKPAVKRRILRQISKKNSFFLVMEENKHLHGFFHGYIEKTSGWGYIVETEKAGYICNTFIEESYRGKGYFSRFSKLFFKFLKKHNLKHCILHVDIMNKGPAKAYEHLGFRRTEYKMLKKL